ncbi:arrestin domain-containing protein 1a isoform X2 [Hippocampus comes]|uniref:arrestin domain-containing protein 1a isoform X2 n=1 Tax=Hippocampus comes TaxID=109280 RepID=UPI00094E2E7D|nr:PREDICTED: arrestin domain-containing protein 1-like isoform X2 [Hippocampus comes]
MGKIEAIEITFDNRKELYSPGEYISGNVTIKVGQKLQCKAIKVNCNGFCGITNKVNETTWTAEEQYFNNTVSVSDKGTLKQGHHTFPFKFLIPGSAPTSFEGNYGKIVYRLRAFVDTPRFTKDYSTEKAFYLLDPLNLNKIPDIWGPCSSSVIQEFSYMLLKTGTVMLKAQIDKKGYTPGQVIQLSTVIHNKSEKTTSNINASLVQVSLKSPNVLLTLPLHIGNVALDKKFHPSKNEARLSSAHVEDTSSDSASAATSLPPPLAPKPTPRPAPRSRLSSSNTPTAPPTEYHLGADGGAPMSGSFSNHRHSQLVSPSGFSYAPGLSFSNSHQNRSGTDHGRTPISGSTRTSTLPSNEHTASSVLTPVSLPPDYRSSAFPQEAPPSYDESCNS